MGGTPASVRDCVSRQGVGGAGLLVLPIYKGRCILNVLGVAPWRMSMGRLRLYRRVELLGLSPCVVVEA